MIEINKREFCEVQRSGIPKFEVNSYEYKDWWGEQRRRCLWGYSIGGMWIPGKLYYYVNFHHIRLNVKGSSRKLLRLPQFDDIELEIFMLFDECKNDPNPYRGLNDYSKDLKLIGSDRHYRDFALGSKGMIVGGSRDSGKSYMAGGIIAHEYTFYEESECVISASVEGYSNDLSDKVKIGLDNLDGAITYYEEGKKKVKPAPFSHRRLKKDFYNEVRSGYYKNGIDTPFGYNSVIYNLVYGNNQMAANGKRPSVHVFEEAGAWEGSAKLIDCYTSSIPCWEAGEIWRGVPIVQGTGGNMKRGTTDLHKMFYNPANFNCLTREDTWEHKGKIGYFIPATKAVRNFKDENGNSKIAEAESHYLKKRKDLEKGDRRQLLKEIMYRPLKPSEMFLRESSGIFPTREVQLHLANIETNEDILSLERRGTLHFSDGEVTFIEDNDLIAADFPATDLDKEGCVVIWELPVDGAPEDLYIAGTDPVDQDDAIDPSLASTIIYKRYKAGHGTYCLPVAEYTGRPNVTDDYYEGVRRLLMFYNARTLYENQLKGMYSYFKKKKSLHLLLEAPEEIIKEVHQDSKVQRPYGIHMTKEIKKQAELYVRDWLLEEYAPGKLNLTKIYSIPLLKELIAYDREINTDRVIAFMLCIMHNIELEHTAPEVQERKEEDIDTFFEEEMFVNRH